MKKSLLPLFLFLSVNCWASFPTTSVLDTATRANENPLSDSGQWSEPTGVSNPLKLVSNQIVATGNATADASYWNVSTFGPDSEVYFTVNTILSTNTNQMRGFLRFDPVALNGYTCSYTKGATDSIVIKKVTGGAVSTLATYSQNVSTGDSVGCSMIGTTITAYYEPSGGSWSSLGTITDSTYSAAGNIAMENISTSASSGFINFGGGTYVPPAQNTGAYSIANATIRNATIR